jgi:hypothetical protein
VLRRRCLNRRIGDEATLIREIAAWVADRNAEAVIYSWRFTPEDARRALPHCYPTLTPPDDGDPSDTPSTPDNSP